MASSFRIFALSGGAIAPFHLSFSAFGQRNFMKAQWSNGPFPIVLSSLGYRIESPNPPQPAKHKRSDFRA
jgi:hypothetical protein